MDRDIPQEKLRARRFRGALIFILIISLISLTVYLTRKGLGAKVDGKRILIATAEVGKVSHTISTAGLVYPAFEEVISSPIQATIKEVILPVGAEIKPNQSILSLDKSFAKLDYEQQKQELRLKANSVKKLRLELEKSFFDLQITDSTQALNISQLEAELKDAIRLEKIGGGTQEDIKLIDTKLRIAKLQKRKYEHDLSIEKQQTEASIEDLQIQYNIQKNSLNRIKEKLDRADISAARPGILTWANENIGSTVQEGEVLARIADLSSYKVIGTCSDLFMDRLQEGMRVIVQLNSTEKTEGTITNIRPTVENNIMTFDVTLDERDHALLRPNMKVEIFVVTASKSQVVRVENGPAFNGSNSQYLFVIEEERAVRREVKVGLTSFDFVEIEANLRPGEKVIISNMERYESQSEITIN